MFTIKNITKKYHEKTILDNVSLTINPGEIAVLLGPSGVGKSTLLRILNNLEQADSGSLFLDNTPLDLQEIHRRHLVGLVFQSYNLFDHLSVKQNITIALEKVLRKSPTDADAMAKTLLQHYGLAELVDARVSSLSGGQKQRLALARTLALKPRLICLDEPTSALDPVSTTHIAMTVQDLANQGYMVLITTHDVSLIDRLSCTLYLMQDGKIVEQATTGLFKQNPTNYPKLQRFIAGDKH